MLPNYPDLISVWTAEDTNNKVQIMICSFLLISSFSYFISLHLKYSHLDFHLRTIDNTKVQHTAASCLSVRGIPCPAVWSVCTVLSSSVFIIFWLKIEIVLQDRTVSVDKGRWSFGGILKWFLYSLYQNEEGF